MQVKNVTEVENNIVNTAEMLTEILESGCINLVILDKSMPEDGEAGILYYVKLENTQNNTSIIKSVLIDEDKEDDMVYILVETIILTYLNYISTAFPRIDRYKNYHIDAVRDYYITYQSLIKILSSDVIGAVLDNLPEW